MSPQRIQMSRQHPWRAAHPDAVIVSRGSTYGNPFPVDGWFVLVDGRPRPTKFPTLHPDAQPIPDAATAVELYREHLRHEPGLVDAARSALAGRDLACWCPLDQPCHADVLLDLANGATEC